MEQIAYACTECHDSTLREARTERSEADQQPQRHQVEKKGSRIDHAEPHELSTPFRAAAENEVFVAEECLSHCNGGGDNQHCSGGVAFTHSYRPNGEEEDQVKAISKRRVPYPNHQELYGSLQAQSTRRFMASGSRV